MALGGVALATDFAVLIVAATVLSYLAKLTKQPTIVAYVLTGVVVGPIGLGIVAEGELIDVIAELGLGFLLFLLGIKMRFSDIREIMRPVAVIAVGQALLQAVASTGVALLLGFSLFQSLMIALATTFGATPIIVKVLGDKDDLKELYGKVDVGVLIFQDLYLVVALAILAVGAVGDAGQIAASMGRVFLLMALIGVVAYLASRYFMPTLLRASAANEATLFALGVAWAFVFIYVAETLDLSVEIGAFLAGLALAQLPYSTELRERMRPVTDLFIAVFFASIALGMEVESLLEYWQEAVIASVLLIAINSLIVFGLFYSQRFAVETSFLGTISMLQVSEFSLVLGALALDQGFIEEGILGFLSLMALITMPVSTYYVLYNRRIYAAVEPYLRPLERDDPIETDPLTYRDHAVIVGYDRFTRPVADELAGRFEDVVVVENRRDPVEELQESDLDLVFGDPRHGEIRADANVESADVLVSAADRTDVNRRLVEAADGDAVTVVTAPDAAAAETLTDAGADYIVRERELVGEVVTRIVTDLDAGRDAATDRFGDGVRSLSTDGATTGGGGTNGAATDGGSPGTGACDALGGETDV
ncbi:cation:proton antiporter [Halorubrum gandharaense]